MDAPESATSTAAPVFFGKYRGTVVNNVDPEQIGRIIAECPDVAPVVPLSWALPCLPAEQLISGRLAVPPIGASVWLEFEQGSPNYPVWTGGFFGNVGSIPAAPPLGRTATLQTAGGNAVVLDDDEESPSSGGIQLVSPSGSQISVNSFGVFITTGKGAVIALVGPQFDVNSNGLTVI